MTRRTLILALAALVVCVTLAAWHLWEARQAGAALVEALSSTWPEGRVPVSGTRDALLKAAGDLRDGRFRSAVHLLATPKPLTAADRAAAQRFLGKNAAFRQRFVAAAAAAERREGDAAAGIRGWLQRALAAAAVGNPAVLDAYLRLAEAALDGLDSAPGAAGRGGPEAVMAEVQGLEPAVNLSRELMTEGYAAAEKVLARASWHLQANQVSQAGSLVDLAARLLGVGASAPTTVSTAPAWFVAMAQAPPTTADKARTEAAVRLCEAVATSESLGRVVFTLVERARRELDAGRTAEAYWWASVALRALGMTEESIVAAKTPAEGTR
jgi:hypothetical protein